MRRLLLAVLIVFMPVAAQAQNLLVFAAASLKTALDEITAAQGVIPPANVKISYAASSALARQIESGAPADLFLSADLDWMDYLDQKKLLRPGTRGTLLGNRIVLIAPSDSKASVKIAPGFDLAGLLGRDGRLAMADVNAVPAGKYGKAALEALRVWPSVSGRTAQAENVRATLLLVARGEAPAGIVYATDAAAEKTVRVLDAFPASTHPPILYPAAQLVESRHPQAAAWLGALRSHAAKAVFEKNGFTVIPAQAAVN
ncbi:molybdate ABC transporter substrate-binding protein [Ferrovibrio terrae]|uniref:Molybdate ABC transporter substrate-binding protein n=1 Tax=Ferrovibrio terrae TaxID=2594003 RepID=A0A516GZR5_9PROT|nr:molybdate ABC transporter substrate-binding protein [Ferrovibrio terrae]QDO97017.1 molybdate ABC transporter substrate-binding protein [Ferrovibrio terrae]